MALIFCPDCSKMVSEDVEKCPKCGCPGSKIREAEANKKAKREAFQKRWAVSPKITLLVIGGFAVAVAGYCYFSFSGSNNLERPDSGVISYVRKGHLTEEALLGVTKDAYDRAVDSSYKGDGYGLKALGDAGLVFVVKPYTSVLILDGTSTTRQIRILDGPWEGKAGWCARGKVVEDK